MEPFLLYFIIITKLYRIVHRGEIFSYSGTFFMTDMIRFVYSERQKYFDVHYKASGRMRTDLQGKSMLRIANPAQ